MKANLKRKLGRGIVRSLGVHDVFSALTAERAGIETLFIGGFGATASGLGMPDLGIITLTEMAQLVARVSARVSVPVVADGDTGHGGVHNVQRTVQEFEAAGAAGVILEDQVSPKRCGHFLGKDVIPAADMILKIKAAAAARKNSDFVLIARTDARDVHGLKDAIARVNRYHEAGADVVFIESPATEKELQVIPQKVDAPLLVNMLTGGKTPNLPVSVLEKMGYDIVVYPIESLLVSAVAVRRLTRAIMDRGAVDKLDRDMIDFAEVKSMLGLEKFLGIGGTYGSRR